MLADSPLEGVLAALLIATVVLSLLLSPILRALYRRAITGAMRGGGDPGAEDFSVPAPSRPNGRELRFVEQVSQPRTVRRTSLAAPYVVAGLIYALAMAVILLRISGMELLPKRTLVLTLIFAIAPMVFAVSILGLAWRWSLVALAVLFSILFALAGVDMAAVYLIWAFPAGLVALVLASPYLRTTSIPVLFLSGLLAASLLLVLELAMFFLTSGVFDAVLGVLPDGLVQAINLTLSLVVSLAVAFALGVLSLRLVARVLTGSSEVMMQTDVLLGMQTVWMIVIGWGDVGIWGLTYGLAFVLYRLSFRFWVRAVPDSPPFLLLLRVFGNQKGQEDLSRRRLLNWRQRGPVLLIGAADLATETLDASEMAAFLNRRLGRLFISSPAEMEASLNAGVKRSPDGLFPMRDYYCRDTTWKPTVQSLMQRASVVILDMRGFSVSNLGVQFEINELAQRVPADHITVLVDDSTDVELAKNLFREAWSNWGNPSAVPDQLVFEKLGSA